MILSGAFLTNSASTKRFTKQPVLCVLFFCPSLFAFLSPFFLSFYAGYLFLQDMIITHCQYSVIFSPALCHQRNLLIHVALVIRMGSPRQPATQKVTWVNIWPGELNQYSKRPSNTTSVCVNMGLCHGKFLSLIWTAALSVSTRNSLSLKRLHTRPPLFVQHINMVTMTLRTRFYIFSLSPSHTSQPVVKPLRQNIKHPPGKDKIILI